MSSATDELRRVFALWRNNWRLCKVIREREFRLDPIIIHGTVYVRFLLPDGPSPRCFPAQSTVDGWSLNIPKP